MVSIYNRTKCPKYPKSFPTLLKCFKVFFIRSWYIVREISSTVIYRFNYSVIHGCRDAYVYTLVGLGTLHGQIDGGLFVANDHNLLSSEKLSGGFLVQLRVIHGVHDFALEHVWPFAFREERHLGYVPVFPDAHHQKLEGIPLHQ